MPETKISSHSFAHIANTYNGEIMKNKNRFPDLDKQPISDNIELNTCSTYDCTGLIPAGLTSEAEAEAYEELFPYITPPSQPNK